MVGVSPIDEFGRIAKSIEGTQDYDDNFVPISLYITHETLPCGSSPAGFESDHAWYNSQEFVGGFELVGDGARSICHRHKFCTCHVGNDRIIHGSGG